MRVINRLATMVVAVAAVQAMPANAAEVIFVPPSDDLGRIYSSNSNDAYAAGRGVVFSPTTNYNLASVGLLQNLTNITLNYVLSLTPASTGNVGGGSVIASGSRVVTTSGLEFVDFSLASPTTLVAGQNYHLAFSFLGNSNQNFFYDQRGSQPYSQPGFNLIDGTQGGDTSNFVLARIRLSDSVAAAVPEPATWAMMLIGFGFIGGVLRSAKRREKLAVSFA